MARNYDPAAAESWKVSLPCTRSEAGQLKDDMPAFALLPSPPTLTTSEADPAQPDEWRLDAYFDTEPGRDEIALLRSLVPSADATEAVVERLGAEDWVSLSQAGLGRSTPAVSSTTRLPIAAPPRATRSP